MNFADSFCRGPRHLIFTDAQFSRTFKLLTIRLRRVPEELLDAVVHDVLLQ